MASGYEAVVAVYGHSLIFEGFGQHYETGVTSSSGLLMTMIRVRPRVHLTARARVQERAGTTDALGGGGVLWRASRTMTILVGAAGGPGNTILPKTDVVGEFVKYAGVFEFGGNVRRILFATTDVVVASPVFAWDTDRWRFDTRYSFSRSHFSETDETTGDHSIMCQYDARRLPADLVDQALCAHSSVAIDGRHITNPHYSPALVVTRRAAASGAELQNKVEELRRLA